VPVPVTELHIELPVSARAVGLATTVMSKVEGVRQTPPEGVYVTV